MGFSNPDNRMKLAVSIGIAILSMWFMAVWVGSEKLGWTGGLAILPFIATIIWAVVGYDAESAYEAEERRNRKKSRGKLDKVT